jgi:hypothetical protein
MQTALQKDATWKYLLFLLIVVRAQISQATFAQSTARCHAPSRGGPSRKHKYQAQSTKNVVNAPKGTRERLIA